MFCLVFHVLPLWCYWKFGWIKRKCHELQSSSMTYPHQFHEYAYNTSASYVI